VEAYGPSTRVVLRVIFVVLGVLGLLWIISRITGIILLLVLSIFFAYLVSPLVEFLRRPRTVGSRTVAIPKGVAIALSYLLILAAIVFAIFVLLPSLSNQFPEFATQAKEYWKSLGDKTQQIIEYSKSRRIPARVVDAANDAVPKVLEKVSTTATEFATTTLAYVLFYAPWLILIPILAFFLLKDAEDFRRTVLLALPMGHAALPRNAAELKELGCGYCNCAPSPEVRMLKSMQAQVAEARGLLGR